MKCSMAGLNVEDDRESIGVPFSSFSSSSDCPPHHVCPNVGEDFKDICMVRMTLNIYIHVFKISTRNTLLSIFSTRNTLSSVFCLSQESWSGVVACQLTEGHNNPTWTGVGVWTYRQRDGECDPATIHPLFTNEDLNVIRQIMGEREESRKREYE